MQNNWTNLKLSDFAQINPTESIQKGKQAKYIPMEYITPFTRRISKFALKSFKGGTKFKNSDTLMARITPCLENGKTSFVDILEEGEIGFGSTEYLVFRNISEVSNSKYIYYLIISPRFRETAIKSMSGTSGRQRVQTNVLAKTFFRLPPLNEQQSIAQILSSLDDKIELLREENKTLESIAQLLFKRWFVDFEFPNEKGNPYRTSEGEMTNSELGEIPIDWNIGILKDLVTIRNGFAFKSSDYKESGIPIIRTTNFTEGSILLNNMVYLANNKAQFYSRFYLNKFDLLLVMVGASIGKSTIVPSNILPALQNQNMWDFIPLKQQSRFYINFLLKKLVNDKISSASGSAREFFRKDYFYNINVIIPSPNVLMDFYNIINSLFEKIDLNLSQVKYLNTLKELLLPKLVSGEIEI